MAIAKLTRNGLPFSNVVANGTATANVSPGRTIEKIVLKLGGTAFTKAMITALKVKANGKVIIDTDGATLDKLNAYHGVAQDPKFLEILFADYCKMSEFDRQVSAFDTSLGIANITIEATITGATAPTLEMKLVEGSAQKDKTGAAAPFAPLLRKLLSYPFNIATGGRLPLTVPFGPVNGAIIERLHVVHTGNMTAITVKQDSMVFFEATKDENENEQKMHHRVPQAGIFTVDFVVDGNIRKALDTRDAKSLEWMIDFSGADNGVVLVEYLDVLGNL